VVDYITQALESRRDAIGRAWFSQVLPLEGFRIVDDHLAFDDLAVQYGFFAAPTIIRSPGSCGTRHSKKKRPRRKPPRSLLRSSLCGRLLYRVQNRC